MNEFLFLFPNVSGKDWKIRYPCIKRIGSPKRKNHLQKRFLDWVALEGTRFKNHSLNERSLNNRVNSRLLLLIQRAQDLYFFVAVDIHTFLGIFSCHENFTLWSISLLISRTFLLKGGLQVHPADCVSSKIRISQTPYIAVSRYRRTE